MVEEKDSDVRKYLREIGLAREKGGALNEMKIRHGGTAKGASIKMATMINKVFDYNKTEVVTIRRLDLASLFGIKVLESPNAGKPPTLKKYTRKILVERGIKVIYSKEDGLLDFIKVEATKNKPL